MTSTLVGNPTFQNARFIFLDRDGVINRKAPEGAYVSNWDEFQILDGVELAIASLNRSGKHVLVLTNQRGIALGLYSLQEVSTLHGKLQEHLAAHGAHIDQFYVCPHEENSCDCRKPATGLLEQAFRDYPEATISNSILIGDSLSDIQAAGSFGIPAILIRDGTLRDEHKQAEAAGQAVAVSTSLKEAVAAYLL
jgi:D-glycero-D-manno-heptose 1,7-bisphosphate phosphatase